MLFLSILWAAAFAADVERREVGQLVFEGVPTSPPELAERVRRYGNARSATLVGFTADDRSILITTRFGETEQLHRVDAPGGARTQLTFFPEPIREVLPSPSVADQVLFSRDVGGNEDFQIWRLSLTDGAASQVSPGLQRATDAIWSDDGASAAWTQTLEGSAKGIMVAPVATPGPAREVARVDGEWAVESWFPDASRLLLRRYVSISESELHTLDVATGVVTRLFKTKKPASWSDAALTRDGRWLYAVTDRDSDVHRLWRLPLDRGREQLLSEGITDEVESVMVSPDGATVAFTTNADGRSQLFLRAAESWTALPVPTLPPGVITALHFDHASRRVAFSLDRADAPSDVYSFEVGQTALTRWTTSEVGGLSLDSFVEPEFVRVPSFDGRQVPAMVYRGRGDGPRPVIIGIHGGPEGQSRPQFSSTYQLWVELGYTVVVPNVRGSLGFGREYHQLDNGLLRKDSVADIGAVLDWIGKQPTMNADKVVVYGGSYGGYMVLACLIDYADRLVGGVDIVGISDFKTFLTNTRDYRRDLRRAEYGDERDPKIAAFFDEISPLKNAGRIADPLFVIQGANDPRVPATEAEQIVAAARASGHDAWYLLAKDEGHGFRKKTNRDAQSEAVVLYLQKVFGE